jgi:hypothetical protein
MSRALFLGTLLFAGLFLNMSWAQNKTEPSQTRPPFPFTKTTFELVLGNGILRWQPKCPGCVLRIQHQRISPRERLQHKHWAQLFIMPS